MNAPRMMVCVTSDCDSISTWLGSGFRFRLGFGFGFGFGLRLGLGLEG